MFPKGVLVIKPCPLCDALEQKPERVLNSMQLVRCLSCSFVFLDMTDEEIKVANANFDSESTKSYELKQTLLDELWMERICGWLGSELGHQGRVVDVGCGNGLLLGKFMSAGWQAHGIDLSEWALDASRKYGFTVQQGEVENMDLEEGSFDLAVSTSTLEHIARPREHVESILRLVRPGGIAYFCGVPNYGSAPRRLGVSAFHHNAPPRHVNYFTWTSFRRLLLSPGIAGYTGHCRIRTYGIPEVFKFYNSLARKARKLTGLKKATTAAGISNPVKDRVAKGQYFAKLLVGAYYIGGQPLHLGDKLEAVLGRV